MHYKLNKYISIFWDKIWPCANNYCCVASNLLLHADCFELLLSDSYLVKNGSYIANQSAPRAARRCEAGRRMGHGPLLANARYASGRGGCETCRSAVCGAWPEIQWSIFDGRVRRSFGLGRAGWWAVWQPLVGVVDVMLGKRIAGKEEIDNAGRKKEEFVAY
jgi:hypothetical protein